MELFRWTTDPWAGLRQLRSEMEDAFGRVNRALGVTRSYPPINVVQDDEGVSVHAEVPGVKADDLSIELERDTLRLTIKRPTIDGVKDAQFHRRERPSGEYTRELRMPAGLDGEKIEANLSNGVLSIRLPKAEEAKPRKIEVKAG